MPLQLPLSEAGAPTHCLQCPPMQGAHLGQRPGTPEAPRMQLGPSRIRPQSLVGCLLIPAFRPLQVLCLHLEHTSCPFACLIGLLPQASHSCHCLPKACPKSPRLADVCPSATISHQVLMACSIILHWTLSSESVGTDFCPCCSHCGQHGTWPRGDAQDLCAE